MDRSLSALSQKNVDEANSTINLNERIQTVIDKISPMLASLPAEKAAVIGTIADSIDRCGEYGTNIAEVAINSAMNSKMQELV